MLVKLRTLLPSKSEWTTLEAESVAAAIQKDHDDFGRESRSLTFYPNPELRGNRVFFALYEIENGDQYVSRIYKQGIVRKGGVRRPGDTFTLQQVAEKLGWEKPLEELLGAGWEGEEEKWT